MEYASLVEVYQELAATSKRLEKTRVVAEFLKKVPEGLLAVMVCLLRGSVFSAWDARRVGFSSQLMVRALSRASGVSQEAVVREFSKKGDLGVVAEELLGRRAQRTLVSSRLTVEKVVGNIRRLSEVEGEGTVDRKVGLVVELLASASSVEARFVVRTVLEQLRVGIAEGIVRDAIAQAFGRDVEEVEEAFNACGDYGEVAVVARRGRLGGVSLRPGRPTKVMLSVVAGGVEEAFKALGRPVQCEFKLDGFRLLIHKDGEKVVFFTRRLENVTGQFPDLVGVVRGHVRAESCILDAEAVGFDRRTGRYLPFQAMSQRIRRKYSITEMSEKFPVEVNLFDILFYNGRSVMDEELQQRRKLLGKIVKEEKRKIVLTRMLVTADVKEARRFFQEALRAGTEGLMLKNLHSLYKPGRYVGGWMKLKQTLEPLDLVIVGAEYGTGKRAGMLTSYVLACRSGRRLVSCGMVSTGVKEKEQEEGVTYAALTRLLKPLVVSQKGRSVVIKPEVVVEVAYEEIQKSPTYESGFALRFPRFRRLRVEEKSVRDVNTLSDVERVFKLQRRR